MLPAAAAVLALAAPATGAAKSPRLSSGSKTCSPKPGANCAGVKAKGKFKFHGDLSRINLKGARLVDANLSGANLYRANLAGADLRGATIDRADLRGANLSNADLRGAKIRRSDLRNAKLRRADAGPRRTGKKSRTHGSADVPECSTYCEEAQFVDSDLEGAGLPYANLTGANLTGANLTGANVTGANLTGANVTGANLTGANLTSAVFTNATGCLGAGGAQPYGALDGLGCRN